MRNAVNAGQFPGPRILACTPEYTVSGGLGDDSRLDLYVPSVGVVCDGPDAFRKSVRELIREGVDIVKFNNSGDSFTLGRLPGDVNPMTEDEVRAICETTLNLGKRVAAHAHADGGVLQCIKYGVEFINHATFASDKTIEALAKRSDKHWVIPAIAARYNTTYEASDWGITTEIAEATGNKRELEAGCETMTKMHQAGIRVLPFGDYGFAWLPIGQDSRDLEHMVNFFGMKPWEALRAATAYGGEAWAGTSGELLGRISKGYLADLLLVDGDPLTDLSILQDKSKIIAVVKDGQFHRRPQIEDGRVILVGSDAAKDAA
jgi:imidazolonepropionase-like amidohydrolase